MTAGQLAQVVIHPDAATWPVVVVGHGTVVAVVRASLVNGQRALVLYVEEPATPPAEPAPVLA